MVAGYRAASGSCSSRRSCFWNGGGALRLAEIIEVLDVGPSEAICSLVVAVKLGADAVEDWL